MMQRYCLILCRSLTYAQRSSRVLERAGITAVVRKAPLSVSKTGCTYCVKLKETQLERALLLLDRAAIQRGNLLATESTLKSEVIRLMPTIFSIFSW